MLPDTAVTHQSHGHLLRSALANTAISRQNREQQVSWRETLRTIGFEGCQKLSGTGLPCAFLLMLVIARSSTLGIANDLVLALAIILAYFFTVAAMAGALTLRAPLWLLLNARVPGLFAAAVGAHFRIEEPDGILTPFLIPLGGGIVLAEVAIAVDRLRSGRP